MIKYFYFILLSLLVSCSSTGIKLVDEYYIYPPDEYYNSYYLKCKLSSDNDPIIDSVHIVYWNDSTIIIERKAKHDNWIINAFENFPAFDLIAFIVVVFYERNSDNGLICIPIVYKPFEIG